MWISHGKVSKIPPALLGLWTADKFFCTFSKLFHSFLLKKDINFVILHQNWRMWITILSYSLSMRNNSHGM